MKTWFTSDAHLGHRNIIRHCARPFSSSDEMDALLIENWNFFVRPHDQVFVLGDFAYRAGRHPSSYLQQLNGLKHLLIGNHDGPETVRAPEWASVHQLLEIKVEGIPLVLCHYPLLSWRGSMHGSLHLHGHEHGRIPPSKQAVDVGVDVWNFQPVSLPEITTRAMNAPRHLEPGLPGRHPGVADSLSVVFLDLEATALIGGAPTEIGLACLDLVSGKITAWSRLIQMDAQRVAIWDHQAVCLTGITRELLAAEGRPASQVVEELAMFLKGETVVYSDCPDADRDWLGELLAAAGEEGFHVEVRDLGRVLERLTDAGQAAATQYRQEHRAPHRAGPDAERLARSVLVGLRQGLAEAGGG